MKVNLVSVTCLQRDLNVGNSSRPISFLDRTSSHWTCLHHYSEPPGRARSAPSHSFHVVHRDMDAATTGSTTPPSGSAGAPHRGRNDPPQLPANLPVSVVAQRRVMKSGGVGSSVRRSPRLSRISPLRPPTECQDMSSGDESESINDVALHLSREETPDNDVLPPDGK